MRPTTIMLPPELKARATMRARKMGMSMGQFIRDAVEKALRAVGPGNEGTMFDPIVYEGPCEADVSRNVDAHLYGMGDDLH
jgi:hypothetical protein